MDEPAAKTLVPPRPNPGPEPLVEPAIGLPQVAAVALGLLVLAILGTWLLRRRDRARGGPSPAGAADAFDDSPSGRVAVLALRARQSLASRFGPQLHARTTEEIALDDRLREALGPDRMGPLLLLLEAADRCKFAPARSPDDDATLEEHLLGWTSLAESLHNGQVKAAARSSDPPPRHRS
ncbi:hypothetical protein OJF2_68320 [Aquisphaera giovannonii]|uniref:DUF4381 domain-containing protein n=2 Tax=Aquisphaera giovannonii TaxID=406548 RepID=A0A5B9WD82_9BACT|nr:hypothetical protein OJF2_68320 [Aquisphaera giovannonii]